MRSAAAVAVAALLAIAVGLTFVCAVGVAATRGPLRKLHFVTPSGLIAPFFFTIAVAIDEGGAQATLKSALVALVCVIQSGVIAHATARAAFVRQHERWPPKRETLDPASIEGDPRT